MVHTCASVHNARNAVIRHKHLVGRGFAVHEIMAAIRALRGAHDDHGAGAHIARKQAVQLAPLFANGEFGAVIITLTGGAIKRPEAAEFSVGLR